jgi:hypothetical protein
MQHLSRSLPARRGPARRGAARGAPAHRQRGLTAIGGLAVLIVVVSAIMMTLKLAPHYIDFYTIQTVIEGLPREEVRSMSRVALNEQLDKRFKINNLREFAIRDIITVERSRDLTVLEVLYERRENLFLNIDVVITFHKRYEYT